MRQASAAVLSALWLTGTVGLPAAHLLHHLDDHLHIGGAIVWLGEEHHHHDDSEYDHYFEDEDWEDEEPEKDQSPPTSNELPPFQHGQGAATHFGASALSGHDIPFIADISLIGDVPAPRVERPAAQPYLFWIRARAPPA